VNASSRCSFSPSARLPGPRGAWVAVKVQRPGLAVRLALDAYLVRQVAAQLQRYVGARGSLVAVVDEMVGRVFEEVDYVREAHNAERFAQLYAFEAAKGAARPQDYDGGWSGLVEVAPGRRRNGTEEGGVRVPRILWRMTTHQILTMEWMEGVKLTDAVSTPVLPFLKDDFSWHYGDADGDLDAVPSATDQLAEYLWPKE
jgi:predicted unusual protein kinase regulating ubiquinone biosynthesis (AarF/ABC1/UbiB family)